MLLTVVYLLIKLTLLVCFSFLRAVISAVRHYCPAEHLFLHVILFVPLVPAGLCSQINDDD